MTRQRWVRVMPVVIVLAVIAVGTAPQVVRRQAPLARREQDQPGNMVEVDVLAG